MLRTILIALIGALTYAQIPAVQGTITDAFPRRSPEVDHLCSDRVATPRISSLNTVCWVQHHHPRR
jgi:hypothetical protein